MAMRNCLTTEKEQMIHMSIIGKSRKCVYWGDLKIQFPMFSKNNHRCRKVGPLTSKRSGVHMCAGAQEPEDNLRWHLMSPIYLLWDKLLPQPGSNHFKIHWLAATQPQISHCLSPTPNAGITSVCHHALHFQMGSEAWTHSDPHDCEASTGHLSYPSALSYPQQIIFELSSKAYRTADPWF